MVMLASACSSDGAAPAVVSNPDQAVTETPGRIATVGIDGLHLVRSDSTLLASPLVGDLVTQPTWSRRGSRVVVSTQTGDNWEVAVVEGASGEVISTTRANRRYFFFSWSHDGTRIAALGPGVAGTTLDLLDSDGNLIADSVASGGSVYVAWEPNGDDLLVHIDNDIVLIEPDLTTSPLGTVGRFFLSASWIPGTRDFLVIAPSPNRPHLLRLGVDALVDDPTADPIEDLGPTDGVASTVVDPSGSLATLLHAPSGQAPDQGDTIAAAYRPAETTSRQDPIRPIQNPTASVEIVDLATGGRTPIIDASPLWGEWSPDGRHFLVATFDIDSREGVWSTWDGRSLTRLTNFLPTSSFLQRYLLFADQYVEQPRLWAPDSSAFTYAGRDRSDNDAAFIMGLDPGEAPVELDAASVSFWSSN